MSPRHGGMYAWALALPGTLLIVATAALLAAVPFGVDPWWRVESLTLPEAAGVRDNGEVIRLIARGGDPNAAAMVRAGLVHSSRDFVLTPLEAAVAARREDMVELLFENGATIDAAAWARLTCFAGVVKAPDVREALDARRPADASPVSCETVATPWPATND